MYKLVDDKDFLTLLLLLLVAIIIVVSSLIIPQILNSQLLSLKVDLFFKTGVIIDRFIA